VLANGAIVRYAYAPQAVIVTDRELDATLRIALSRFHAAQN
jgi:hypothetical protein